MLGGEIWTAILGFPWGAAQGGVGGLGPWYTRLFHEFFDAAPILLCLGLLLEGLIGGLPGLWRRVPHPVALFGRLVASLDRRLNREKRSETVRRARGTVVVILLTVLAGAIGWEVHDLARSVPGGGLIEVVAIAILLAGRSLFDHVRAVSDALEHKGLTAARRAVRHIVGRDVAALDAHGVARAAIESGAENFSDALVAPSLWYLLLGLPGLFAYKAVNTMDSMIGYRTPRHNSFGWAAARLDDVLNYVPARLAAWMILLATLFVPHTSPTGSLRVLWRDGGNHASPNSGRPEAAMAGALGLALAGPRPYHGEIEPALWIGDGHAEAMPADIDRALHLYAVACGIHLALIAALATALML